MSSNTETEATDAQAAEIGTEEGWEALDTEEQDALLQERLDEEVPTASTGTLSEEATASAIERLEGKLEETWEAVILGDVVVECYELSESQMDAVYDKAQLIFEVSEAGQEGVEDAEELDSDLLDEMDALTNWLVDFLADITEPEEMDAAYWEAGERFPQGTRLMLFMQVFDKYKQDVEDNKSFR